MSLKISAAKAKISWLSKSNSNLLASSQGILYVPKTPVKLGQVTKDSVKGMTPQQAFESRYKDKSSISEDILAEDIFVFDKMYGASFGYDDGVRKLIHKLHRLGKIPFDALTPEYQEEGYNSEALINYDRRNRPTLEKVIKQYLGIKTYWDTRQAVTWWWGQEQEVNEITSKLLESKLCLYAAYTGRGKTTISVGVASKMFPKGGLVLVTTPIRDTRNGFEEKIQDWYFGDDRTRKVTFIDNNSFKKTTAKELRERADAGELIFVVLTVQDVRYKDKNSDDLNKLRRKYNSLAGHLDMWIRDERHLQYEAELTAKRLGNLAAEYELDLTATPYNVLDKYDSKQVVARTLIWGLRNREHTNLPEIGIDAIATPFESIDSKLSAIYSDEEGFDPRKLFVRQNNNFVFQSELIALAEQFYQSTFSKNKNKLSIVNDTELDMVSKRCGMWVLPDGQSGDAASDYIPALAKMLNANANGKVLFKSSYEIEAEAKSEGISIGAYVGNLLKENPTVIVLTCGKFTTGTDIAPMGHIVLMDNMSSIAAFEQLLGRMERVYEDKNRVKLYTIMPGQSVKVILGRLSRESAILTGTNETEMLDCIPFTEYDSGKPRKVDISEILEATQDWFKGRVKDKLPAFSLSRELATMDLALLKNLDLSKFKSSQFKSDFTDKNGAKVTVRLNAEGKPQTKKERNLVNKAVAVMQTVMQELQWIAYKNNCYDYDQLFTNDSIKTLFGDDLIAVMYNIIKSNDNVSQMVRQWLLDKQQAYASLPLEDVLDDVFINSDYKLRMGLVYLPLSAARHIVSDKNIKNIKKALILNARNGSIIVALREKLPNIEIVCAEPYSHFSEYLSNKFGVSVIENINSVDDLVNIKNIDTFDMIFVEPPVNRRNEARTYIQYFKSVLELKNAPLIVSILPDRTGSTAHDISKHNERIERHNYSVIYNLNKLYPDIGGFTQKGDHICVIASGKRQNKVAPKVPFKEKLANLKLPYPERDRIVPTNSGYDVLAKAPSVKNGVKIIERISRNDDGKYEIKYKTVDKELAHRVPRRSDTPYLVIVNRRPVNGRLNVAYVKNSDNLRWTRWVFAIEATSKTDAIKLTRWLSSEEVKSYIIKMLELRDGTASNIHRDTPTISLSMLKKIPTYR